jgi:hypothetical protein
VQKFGLEVNMAKAIQLETTVAQGASSTPTIVNPDGTHAPFSIPSGMAFVLTDISIFRLLVVGTPGLFFVEFTQSVPPSAVALRWSFVGTVSENIERSFTTGVRFASDFSIGNGSQSADAVNVRLSGYFDWL